MGQAPSHGPTLPNPRRGGGTASPLSGKTEVPGGYVSCPLSLSWTLVVPDFQPQQILSPCPLHPHPRQEVRRVSK